MNPFQTNKLISPEKAIKIAQSLHKQNKTIVFTNGCFDILHPGHVYYLAEAKKHGDILWVGLNSDSSVQTIKGPSRPIHSEQARAFVLSHLDSVDYLTIFNEENPINIISMIKPSIHIKGGDYKKEMLIETPTVESYGGSIIIKPFLEGFSTTSILNKQP